MRNSDAHKAKKYSPILRIEETTHIS